MDKEKLVKRLMATFLEELEDHVRALNRDLLALEKDAGGAEQQELLKTLFRTAHSLKGASRSVSVNLLEGACHQLEEILSAARDGLVRLGRDHFSLLFETADAIEEAGMRLREQQDLGEAPLAALLPRLEAAARGPRGESDLARIDHKPHEPEKSAARIEEPTQVATAATVPSAPAIPAAEPAAAAASVRVAAEKLDALLAQSGELLVAQRRVLERTKEVIALRELVGRWRNDWRTLEKTVGERNRENGKERSHSAPHESDRFPKRILQTIGQAGDSFRHLEKDLDRLARSMSVDSRLLEQVGGGLDLEIRNVRMLPFADACQGLDRMVRDLAQAAGKEVELVVEGGKVKLDRSVLEALKDPLRHLVRNAVDHGLEKPAERQKAGKPAMARIVVAAVLRGTQVEVAVADDGRGLDLDAFRQQARKRGLAEPADERELVHFIFLPGFSTSRIITDVSGRGVGLDVVKSRLEALHGTVEVSFSAGRGTRFILAVPLTLTTMQALLVRAGEQTFALAGTNVVKLVRVDLNDLRSVEGREMLLQGGPPLPLASLAQTLGLPAQPPAQVADKISAVIVNAGDKRMAFVVDEFVAEQEITIKNLGARIRRLPFVSGATILESGKIALVLNAANVIRTALHRAAGPRLAALPAKTPGAARIRLLLAEDSLTTRTLMKTILEAAGYDVAVAADGNQAWEQLQDQGADLVVADVDMPLMDGFSLTEAVRGSPRFRDVPVVLVTARDSDRDKARGIEVGADAYLVKSAFDQKNLIETIAQLL